ncbi:MAG: purine phosphoribosyltransferase family protein [Candidatus Shapirobacteria bacterium]|jgi:adenine phosphoribosyltransferase
MEYKSFLRPGKGATDISPLLGNAVAFVDLINDLIGLFDNLKVDKVACIEGRGFLLGAPVAFGLKAGLVPIRSPGKLKNQIYSETFIDYSGKEKTLEIHQDAISVGERIVIVDDWVETGATIKAAIKLIEKCGGKVVGVAAFMDDSNDELKEELKKYNYNYIEKVRKGDKY